MSEVNTWSTTAASNNSAVPDGWAENMARSGVNNSAREMMATIRRWQADTNGSTTSGGTANAQTIAANRTTTSAYAGESFTFKAGATNTGAATINITPSGGSARGAVAIQKNGSALVGGEIVSGGMYTIRYDGTQYQLSEAFSGAISDGSVGTPAIRFGADPDNGFYRIGADNWAGAVAGAKAFEFKSDGSIITPLQAMVAAHSAGGTDVTGDGTVYTLTFGTEDFDQGADFSTPTFTAPQTGKYWVYATASVFGGGAGHTSVILNAVATVATYRLDYLEHDLNGTYNMLQGGALIACTAGDTITFTLTGSGSTKTLDVDGGRVTRISIALQG